MSQTFLANIIFVVIAAGALAGEHFGILPAGSANILLGIAGGGAAFSGTASIAKGSPVFAPKAAATSASTQAVANTTPVTVATSAQNGASQPVSTQGANLTPING